MKAEDHLRVALYHLEQAHSINPLWETTRQKAAVLKLAQACAIRLQIVLRRLA